MDLGDRRIRGATVILTGLAALLLCAAAAAQERHYDVTVRSASDRSDAIQKVRVSKAVIGSAQIVIWGGAAIDPDCSPHPGSTLAVVEPPAHGAVKVVEEGIYVAFPPANPRSACNNRKVPGRKVYYTANNGYSGRDKVVLQGASDDGRVRNVTIDINVLKAANS